MKYNEGVNWNNIPILCIEMLKIQYLGSEMSHITHFSGLEALFIHEKLKKNQMESLIMDHNKGFWG